MRPSLQPANSSRDLDAQVATVVDASLRTRLDDGRGVELLDDRADGIYDRDSGRLISQGDFGLPVFVGTMQYSAAELVRLIREERALPPEPGDIYIVNDPYLGGTHLMDVRFVMPFYWQGEHICWLQNTGHWPDVGGMVPGGFSARAVEVEQEGLRLPPVKLFKRGEIDREIYAILMSNMRVADQR
ncbi:MAG: hydantoinase B/oxoprolinase family protein, partial [Hyphomicrobiales bacterium]|nr:hydantoinase B/oxoprolinase family protein [Hyphomicrobiales bacterium]